MHALINFIMEIIKDPQGFGNLAGLKFKMIYSDSFIQHCVLLSESFYRLTKKKLINENFTGKELAETIYHAPFVIVSHGTETDPIFNFANLKAQELWEMNWDEFIKTPSRLSAEPVNQTERQKLLDKAQQYGYISDYNGVRISKSGKKFRIINTTLWNLVDASGQYKGQAATFRQWEYL